MIDYSRQEMNFCLARQALMVPLDGSEDEAIATALQHCERALRDLDPSELDQWGRQCVRQVQGFLHLDGLDHDATPESKRRLRAEQLDRDERLQFSRAVEQIADHFRITRDRQLRQAMPT